MPVDYLLDPAELTRGQRWLRRWWPSSRLGTDPQRGLRVAGRYTPVSIANWKLIPAVARRLLALRVERPLTFAADQSLAVVIPYRDRQDHLAQLLPVLTATLREQQLRHRIIVVEQATAGPFNRGRLLNIGAHHAAPAADYYCLHDVDAVPVRANYLCPSQPLRLVTKIVTAGGESQRPDHYFSGAVSIRKEQMFAANGFSNEYWGWGKEDDDFFFRLLMTGLLCYFDLQGEFRDAQPPSSTGQAPAICGCPVNEIEPQAPEQAVAGTRNPGARRAQQPGLSNRRALRARRSRKNLRPLAGDGRAPLSVRLGSWTVSDTRIRITFAASTMGNC